MSCPRLFTAWPLISLVFILGCVSLPPENELKFNALVFDNRSGETLENVSVKVKQTRAYIRCSVLLKGRTCSTEFQTKRYRGNTVYVSWELDGQAYDVGPLLAARPEHIDSGKNASVMIRFESHANVTVELRY